MALNNQKNIVGVIPSFDRNLNFGFEWDECLLPLEKDYTAIERSVLECAYAGCTSVWITCDPQMIPLIKERMGEIVLDPIAFNRAEQSYLNTYEKKYLPIYYVPINTFDLEKRESTSWQILWSAHSSYYVSKFMSKWTTYDRVYVSFPFGIYDPSVVRQHRSVIRQENVLLTHEGKTVLDDVPLGFSFTPSDFIQSRKNFRALYTKYATETNKMGPASTFKNLKENKAFKIPVKTYHQVSDFDSMRKMYAIDFGFDTELKNNLIPKYWLDKTTMEKRSE